MELQDGMASVTQSASWHILAELFERLDQPGVNVEDVLYVRLRYSTKPARMNHMDVFHAGGGHWGYSNTHARRSDIVYVSATSDLWRSSCIVSHLMTMKELENLECIDVAAQLHNSATSPWAEMGYPLRMLRCQSRGIWRVYDARLVKEKTAWFWQEARKEFSEKTWHPSRIVDWCLSEDEKADLHIAA